MSSLAFSRTMSSASLVNPNGQFLHIHRREIKNLFLRQTASDGRGSHVLGKNHPIDFWLRDFDPSIGVCPTCSTLMVWICSKCKNKIATNSDCPKCGKETPVKINCPKCSTLLLNERGKLSIFTEEKAKKLPERMLKHFPTCKFCDQKVLSERYFLFSNGTSAHANCVERAHYST